MRFPLNAVIVYSLDFGKHQYLFKIKILRVHIYVINELLISTLFFFLQVQVWMQKVPVGEACWGDPAVAAESECLLKWSSRASRTLVGIRTVDRPVQIQI